MNGLAGLFGGQMPGLQMDPRLASIARGGPATLGGAQMDSMRAALAADPNANPLAGTYAQGMMPTPGAPQAGGDGGGLMGALRGIGSKPGMTNLAGGLIGAALAPRSQQGQLIAGGMAGMGDAQQRQQAMQRQQDMMSRAMQRQQMMDAQKLAQQQAGQQAFGQYAGGLEGDEAQFAQAMSSAGVPAKDAFSLLNSYRRGQMDNFTFGLLMSAMGGDKYK